MQGIDKLKLRNNDTLSDNFLCYSPKKDCMITSEFPYAPPEMLSSSRRRSLVRRTIFRKLENTH